MTHAYGCHDQYTGRQAVIEPKDKQHGGTVADLVASIFLVFCVAAVSYITLHFIVKFW